MYTTALNVIEACATQDSDKRVSLIQLIKELGGYNRPLEIPNKLLQVLAIAYARRKPAATLSITKEQEGLWIALNEPEMLDEQARHEVLQWKEQLETDFTGLHRTARPHFQRLFEEGRTLRPQSVVGLIRRYCKDEKFVYEVTAPLYERATQTTLPPRELQQFFTTVPGWPLYFLGWAHAIYNRAIQESGYSPRKKPGTIDLWCAVYLPHCDRFVTHDKGQRKALRTLTVLNPRKTRILSYDTFRKGLLVG